MMASIWGAALAALVLPAARAEPLGIPGSWALDMRVVSAAEIPVIGEVRSTTVTRGLLERGDGSAEDVSRLTVCDVGLTAQSGPIRSSLPEAFLRAFPVRTVSVRLDEDRYTVDLGVTSLGYDPVASDDALPSSSEDPTVVDFEGDGAPGFTVHVDVPLFPTVSIHLVQVTQSVLEGVWAGPDRVVGRPLVSRLEQRVLGASIGLFARSPRIHPVDGAGSFELRRLPDGSTCEAVLDLWDPL